MSREAYIKRKIDLALKTDCELPDLEFKTATDNVPTKIWQSITAFSHRKDGGIIVFGVKENLQQNKLLEVVGCNKIQEMQTKLCEIFNDKISYSLRPNYYIIDYQGKTLLAVDIDECPNDYKPCFYKHLGLPRGAYIRDGITNRQLTDNEFRTYVAKSKNFQFDLSEAEGVSKEDLDEEKIKLLLNESEERLQRGAVPLINDKLLTNLGIIKKFNNELKPTLAGHLIFSSRIPQEHYLFERYTVRCVRYLGNSDSSDIIDKADIVGTLGVQIDEVYKFILKNIKKVADIKDTKRYDRYEYPEKAIRELVSNAIVHRDYKITETYIKVCVYSNRLEIINPGCLPPGVAIENIKDAQFSRNTIIASRLKDLRYLEEYGRGINIVYDKMEEWNLINPLFRNFPNSFEVILFGNKFSKVNNRQIEIVNYLLLKSKVDIKGCMKVLMGVPRVTINSDLKKLKDLGIIEQRGASSSSYYIMALN